MAKKRKTKTTTASSTSQKSHTGDKDVNKKVPFQSFPLDLVLSSTKSQKRPASYQKQQQQQQLALNEIHTGCTVWTIPNFFTPQECQNWISFCERSEGLEYTQHNATNYIAQRECYRMQQSDATDLTEVLFRRLAKAGIIPKLMTALQSMQYEFPDGYQPIGFNPNLRLYKYTKGHAFGRHFDGSNLVESMGMTEITVLIYLSSCTGGATRFYPPISKRKEQFSSFAFDPEPGTMLLHVHGDRCLEHEADQVLEGVKYVLRTDIVFNNNTM